MSAKVIDQLELTDLKKVLHDLYQRTTIILRKTFIALPSAQQEMHLCVPKNVKCFPMMLKGEKISIFALSRLGCGLWFL